MTPGLIGLPISAVESCHQLYRFSDLIVASAWPLPELPPVPPRGSATPALAIRPLAAPPPDPGEGNWIHRWPENSGGMSLGRSGEGNGFLLRFPHLADFVISEHGRAIGAWPAPETSPETLRHLMLDQVLPRVLAHRGRLVVHAGAVCVGQEAIAFIGDTGRGKSTLTGSFYAAGNSLLSDDGLELAHKESATLVGPTYPSLRLWPDTVTGMFARAPDLAPMAHYSSKRRVILSNVESIAPVPLAAIYILAPDPQDEVAGISLTQVSPREACITIISNSFQLDVTDRHRATNLLTAASTIAQQLPVFSLVYPRNFAVLPDVHQAILNQHCQSPTRDGRGQKKIGVARTIQL